MTPQSAPPRSIAIYLHTLYNGGIERVMFHLIQAFLDRGIAVDLVLDELIYSPYERLLPQGTRLVKLGAHKVTQRVPRLTAYLRESCPEAMLSAGHLANEVACIATKLAGSATRLIVTEHTTMSAELAGGRRLSTRRLHPWTTRRLYPLADAIVAVSHGVADDLCQVSGLVRSKVQTIYNPIHFDELRAMAAEPLEHPWFRAGEPPVILAIGRLELQKNFAGLLHAFQRIRETREARLLILGEGSQGERLAALVTELGLAEDVSLPGFVANPAAYMARAAVFAMSSAWEGMPVALIEALALGLPVVSTDCPSGPAEVLDGGRYGELVAMNDPDALAAALERVLRGETRMATKAWLDQFDSETITESYLALIADLVSRSARTR